MKKRNKTTKALVWVLTLLILAGWLSGCVSGRDEELDRKRAGILSSSEEIGLRDVDGQGKNYVFTYDGEEFTAVYTPDHWKIVDSYRVINTDDMTYICQALLTEHPIHGSDGVSYRTPEDAAYEWLQHNLVFQSLPENHAGRDRVKDVDLDPADQGKTYMEMYRDRTESSEQ